MDFNRHKGGNEWFLYTDLRNKGGKFIILCIVEKNFTQIRENHAFVFDADYINEDKKVKGAIIDNQTHTKLTGIEESDVRDLTSMRRVCMKLYGGKTFFNGGWEVRKNDSYERLKK